MRAYFLFLQHALPFFTKFNELYQTKHPNLHTLSGEVLLLAQKLMSQFLKKDLIASATDVYAVDLTN